MDRQEIDKQISELTPEEKNIWDRQRFLLDNSYKILNEILTELKKYDPQSENDTLRLEFSKEQLTREFGREVKSNLIVKFVDLKDCLYMDSLTQGGIGGCTFYPNLYDGINNFIFLYNSRIINKFGKNNKVTEENDNDLKNFIHHELIHFVDFANIRIGNGLINKADPQKEDFEYAYKKYVELDNKAMVVDIDGVKTKLEALNSYNIMRSFYWMYGTKSEYFAYVASSLYDKEYYTRQLDYSAFYKILFSDNEHVEILKVMMFIEVSYKDDDRNYFFERFIPETKRNGYSTELDKFLEEVTDKDVKDYRTKLIKYLEMQRKLFELRVEYEKAYNKQNYV